MVRPKITRVSQQSRWRGLVLEGIRHLDLVGALNENVGPTIGSDDASAYTDEHAVVPAACHRRGLPLGRGRPLRIMGSAGQPARRVACVPSLCPVRPSAQLVCSRTGVLLLSFALTMTFALGVKAPLDYSVFTAAAGALFLAAVSHDVRDRLERTRSVMIRLGGARRSTGL